MYQTHLDFPIISGEHTLMSDLEKEFHLTQDNPSLLDKMKLLKSTWVVHNKISLGLKTYFLRKYPVSLYNRLNREKGPVSGRDFLVHEGVRYEIILKTQGQEFQTENVILSFRKLRDFPLGVVMVKEFWE